METIDTAEPDEFARLLGQLNGDPVAPAAPAMPVPPGPSAAPVPPAAPVLPVAPAPSLAPAFGMAVPTPRLPSAVAPAPGAFPAVAPPASIFAPPPPTATPITRAPELMGADELAAPPSGAPATPAPSFGVDPGALPPLVAPPAVAESVAPAAAAAVPPSSVPPAALAAALAASPPPPGSASPSPAPAPVAPPQLSSVAPSASAPGATHAPLDFSALLASPVDADGTPGAAARPLVFGGGPADAPDETGLARSTLSERIGLILAIVVAPIGLILGIVSAIGSVRRRGWVIGMVRATVAVGAVLTVVLAVGGYFAYTQYEQQVHHDEVAAESAAFCATLKSDPSMYQAPTFGWPAVASSIPDSITAMQAFEDRWTKLTKVSPAGIKADVAKEAASAKDIISSVTVSRTIDDASNVALMTSVASSSGIPAWHAEYCG